jgi:RNA polymerase sigma-32 factor
LDSIEARGRHVVARGRHHFGDAFVVREPETELEISNLMRGCGTSVAYCQSEVTMNSSVKLSDDTFYLAAARNAPELSRESESELAQRWRVAGDRRAADVLARAYQRQLVMLAFKYRRYGVPIGELIAEGNFGVVHALRKFQPERGVRFSTYASHWVRAYMLAHVVKSHSAVGGSDGPLRSQVFFKLRRERARVFNQFGTGENAERELARRLGVSLERIRSMLARLDARDVSLDARNKDDADKLVDRLPAPDDQERELSSWQSAGRVRQAVASALALLDARERYVIEQHWLAEPEQERSLADIARSLGVSRERARQLNARALTKLRRHIGAQAEDGGS